MIFSGKYFTVAMAVVLSGAASVPTSASIAAAPASVQPAFEAPAAAAATPLVPAVSPVPFQAPAPQIAAVPAAAQDDDADAPQLDAGPAAGVVASAAAEGNEVDSELECLAKVVLHEAGNQSRTGQMAVAEVVMNRVQDPRRRFGRTICGVVLQPGQFFNVHAYNGRRDPRWRTAVEIARTVRAGGQEQVTNGGLFFRTAYGAGFPGRTRVATIGAHAFYR